MGVLQNSKNQALLISDSSNVQAKWEHKGKEPKASDMGKEPKASDSKPKEIQNYFEGDSGSKRKKKFENTKYPYCMRGFHPERHCMKK